MDIFNRPPSISEDTICYALYPMEDSSYASCSALVAQIYASVNSQLPDTFLWHRDTFELKVVKALPHETGKRTREGWKLEGMMRIGDSVDDEWCVVWLLRELTKGIDVVVSVYDSDGEFLLIEAADVLPAWISPSNADNRVWLYQSHLHLIPIFYTSAPDVPRHRKQLSNSNDSDGEDDGVSRTDDDEYIGVSDALRALRDPTADTLAPPEVESRVWDRIAKYPAAAKQHTHRTSVYVPSDIALTLSQNPALVQRAVETFYTRDALQLRATQRMSRFPPSTSVLTHVRMTRPAYAQLMGQKFHPPKIFGHWADKEGTLEWKRKNLGMKIACGFEMLYAETKSKAAAVATDTSDASTDALKDALQRDAAYNNYVESLVRINFFQGEIRGSQKWNALESQAAKVWVNMRREDDASRQSFASSVNESVARANAASVTAAGDATLLDDSDDWLNVDSDMLDQMLLGTNPIGLGGSAPAPAAQISASGDVEMEEIQSPSAEEDKEAEATAGRLKALAGKVEAFVEGKGNLEGAQFDDDMLSDEQFSDDHSDSEEEESEDDEKLAAIRAERQAQLVPPLPASEYGVMPPSFSLSQAVSAPTIATETTETAEPGALEKTTDNQVDPPIDARPIRRPIIPRDKYDGVDSDDETDSENEAVPIESDEEESDEDRPTVVGELYEVDFEAEAEDFLKFSREALGLSDGQWEGIINERKERGAFVPAATFSSLPESSSTPDDLSIPTAAPSQAAPQQPFPPGTKNPNLDSFEAVMAAMDAELHSKRGPSKPTPTSSSSAPTAKDKGKGKAKADPTGDYLGGIDNDDDDDMEDIASAMAAELKAALETGSDGDDDDEDGLPKDTAIDYNLIKNFLQSFKAQGGLSGPVSNLAGRLGTGVLPRDL